MNRLKGNVIPRAHLGGDRHYFYLLGWISGILVAVALLTAWHFFHLAQSLAEANEPRMGGDGASVRWRDNVSGNRSTQGRESVQLSGSSNAKRARSNVPAVSEPSVAPATSFSSASPQAILHTDYGQIVFELFSQDAPLTVANFVRMARVGVFNQSCFYRYERGFVLQGGLHCNQRPPHAKKAKNVPLEYKRPNDKFSVALARAGGDLNSGGAEFFINLRNNTNSLGTKKKGGYAVFAQVVDGFDTIANMKKLPTKTEGLTRFVSPQPVIEFIEIVHYVSPASSAPLVTREKT